DYELPPHLIAQHPTEQRDASRLMVLNRRHGRIDHQQFVDLPKLLRSGDLLVLNDTRVLPARLFGRRERTGGQWEGLFLATFRDLWVLTCQTGGKWSAGEFITVDPGPLRLELVEKTEEGNWQARPDRPGTPAELLARHGQMPLPPYIRKGRAGPDDAER